jgi:adenylate cyclase class IV
MSTLIPPIYEVETRLNFSNPAQVWDRLPMFQPLMNNHAVEWDTIHYGPALFQTDQILRINHTVRQGKPGASLGWKGPDQGKSVNIRIEIEEDITGGIRDSKILTKLSGKKCFDSSTAVASELIELGHCKFMEYSGRNLTGEYEPQGFQLKLMLVSNPALRYPMLLEIEKTAHSLAEALEYEGEINEFIRRYRLEDRIVREEPPMLLFQALHLCHGL